MVRNCTIIAPNVKLEIRDVARFHDHDFFVCAIPYLNVRQISGYGQ
jgi:hypothetical protein